jgi:hypothetical protein
VIHTAALRQIGRPQRRRCFRESEEFFTSHKSARLASPFDGRADDEVVGIARCWEAWAMRLCLTMGGAFARSRPRGI